MFLGETEPRVSWTICSQRIRGMALLGLLFAADTPRTKGLNVKISELVARLDAIKAQHGDLECRWEHLRRIEVVEARSMGRTLRTDGGMLVEHWNVVYLGEETSRRLTVRREDQTPVAFVVSTTEAPAKLTL